MNRALYRHSLYSFFSSSLFYLCSVLTVIYVSFSFFFLNRFFVFSNSTASLSAFFNSIAHFFILGLPLLCFCLRRFVDDDSIPVSGGVRFFTLAFAAFTVSLIPLALLAFIPVSVNFFGRVDLGQVFTGYAALLFYSFCAVCLILCLFSWLRYSQNIISLFFSIIILFCFNFIHLVPLFLKTGDNFSVFLQKISFAWHFEAASRGIFDSRDFSFYFFASAFFIFLAVCGENRRTGLKTGFVTPVLFLLTVFFSAVSCDRLYFRLDFTKNREFSVSEVTRQLCGQLENPLRITCWQSKELKNFYPQAQEVTEYLSMFASSSKNVFFNVKKAEPEKLERLGIQGRQLKTENSTKVEYTTVYSAILLQYLDKSSIIPFCISTKNLEYDLAQRIQQLVSGNQRNLFVTAGNGYTLDEDYGYVLPWLNARGFFAREVEADKLPDFLTELEIQEMERSQLLILGSDCLDDSACEAVKIAAEKGMSVLVMTSPYTVNLKDEWKVEKKYNPLLKVLNGWGFAFDYSLAEDLANFPLTMTSSDEGETVYKTVNYPLWINVLPQKEAFEGVILAWASPLICYGKTEPLLQTTALAWKQKPLDSIPDSPFLLDPFNIPKTASAQGEKNEVLTLAAILQDEEKNLSVGVVSDQFFLSSLMTGFTSSSVQGDFRNYDYTASLLLKLRGEEKLGELMRKTASSSALYKISDEEVFIKTRNAVLFVCFAVLPLISVLPGIILLAVKRRTFKIQKVKYEK